MKRSFVLILSSLILLTTTLYNCSKSEDGTKVYNISGTITLSDAIKAGGAIVSISSEPNAAKVLTRVVADADGKYTIVGIQDGKYYLSAKYNSANQNNMKSAGGINFKTSADVDLEVSGADATKDIALVADASTGTDVVEIGDGKYEFDQTHSYIGFEFPYDSLNADFAGHFAEFGLNTFKFDQANPANSSIDAWVDITSTETGSPSLIDPVTNKASRGRDGINGCISKTFGVKFKAADALTAEDSIPQAPGATSKFYTASAILEPTGKATFVSTSISAYGDGYLAVGNLTFKGATKEVKLYFHYIKGFSSTKNNVTTQYSSFHGFFMMNALKDFAVSSSHVKGAPVKVITNIQVTKDM